MVASPLEYTFMKLLYLAVAMSSVVALSACDRRDAANDSAAADATAEAADQTAPAAPMNDSVMQADPSMRGDQAAANGDALALGMLGAVDEHEMAAATQAKEKKVGGAVLDYADMMDKEHGENLTQTQALGTLADTADIQAMKKKGNSDLDTLGQKSGKQYEAAYIDAMIAGHQEVLAMIDGKMMPAATTDAVKQHLSKTKDAVQAHLNKAQDIKKNM